MHWPHHTLQKRYGRHAISVGVGLPLLAMAILLDAAAQPAPKQPAMQVGVDATRIIRIEDTFAVLGRFVSLQSGPVAAAVSGPVEDVLVRVGDRVRKGETLARMVTASLRARRDLMKAQLSGRWAARVTAVQLLERVEGELARLRRLRDSAAFPKAQYDDKLRDVSKLRSEVSEAESAIAQGKANLEIAEIDLDRMEIRAPYNGVVTERAVAAGAYLRVGDPVVSIVNNHQMEVEAEVPSNRLSGLTTGRNVRVEVEGSDAIDTRLRSVLPAEDVATRTRLVRLTFSDPIAANAGQEFAANQSVTVMVPAAAARNVLSVHKDAVIRGTKGTTVVVIVDGKAELRPVSLGPPAGNRFTVLKGLKENEVAVVRGNERLRPGQAVRYDPLPAHSGTQGGTQGGSTQSRTGSGTRSGG